MSFFNRGKDKFPIPVVEEIDLKVTAGEISLKKDINCISRILFTIVFPTNTLLYTTFGVDAALTNGINIRYLKELLFDHGIRTNGEFMEFAYDINILTDATAVKINYLTARLSFFKFTKDDLGLKIDSRRKFFLVVGDNLSGSSNTRIIANVQGWRI